MKRGDKNKAIYTLLLLACIIGFWLFENFYTPDTYSRDMGSVAKTEIEDIYLPSSTTGAIVEHEHFTLSYNEPFEQSEWVAHMLKREHLTNDDRKRPYFIEDPKVKSKSADWRNYKGSGFDRGHLCPAGDRRFSKQAYNETFYTSNVSPQDKYFNAGVWNRLEIKIRQWAKKYGKLFVVTGGVLENGLNEIGEEEVDVPRYFYKIVARGEAENLKVIGFLLLGKESTKPLKQFTVSVDKIEKMTGIDFFYRISNDLEVELESKVEASGWGF